MATRRCLIETLEVATIAFFSLALTIPAISAAAPPPAPVYKNHTVGEAAGWFFNTSSNAASANYSDWAASQTFYLGEYLSNVCIHQISLHPLVSYIFIFSVLFQFRSCYIALVWFKLFYFWRAVQVLPLSYLCIFLSSFIFIFTIFERSATEKYGERDPMINDERFVTTF